MQPQSPSSLVSASSDLYGALHSHSHSQSSFSEFPAGHPAAGPHMCNPGLLKLFSFLYSLGTVYRSLHTNCSTRPLTFLVNSNFPIAASERVIHTWLCPHTQAMSLASEHLYSSQIYQSSSVEWELYTDRSHICFLFQYILCLISCTPFINICWMNENVQMNE